MTSTEINKRIAELEKENKVLKITIDHCIKDWQVEQMMLEQQAKGIEESLNYVMESKSKIVTVSSLLLYAEDLRKQASELDKAK